MKRVALSALLAFYLLSAALVAHVAGLQLASHQLKQLSRAVPKLKARAISPLHLTNAQTAFNESQIVSSVGDKTYKQCSDSAGGSQDAIQTSTCLSCLTQAASVDICEGCCLNEITEYSFMVCPRNSCCIRFTGASKLTSDTTERIVFSFEPYRGGSTCQAVSRNSDCEANSCAVLTVDLDVRDPLSGRQEDCEGKGIDLEAYFENVPAPSKCATDSDRNGTTEKAKCFAGDAIVLIEGGIPKRMDEVEIGDRVQVGPELYSPVFAFTHRDLSKVSDFVRVLTASGASIAASSGHYIYVNDALSPISSVRIGDSLSLSSGAKALVTEVSVESGKGLFNPQTVHGDIVVDGVLASTYTTAVSPGAAHATLAPLRMLYEWTAVGFSMLPKGMGSQLAPMVRTYSKATNSMIPPATT